MIPNWTFDDALARLDADIAETEAKLTELRAMRQGAELFLKYMMPGAGMKVKSNTDTARSLGADLEMRPVVEDAVRRNGAVEQHIDDVYDAVVAAVGHDVERTKVRDSLYYLKRLGIITNGAKRGTWLLLNAEAPSPASEGASGHTELGAEGGEHSNDEPRNENHRDYLTRWNGEDRSGASIAS